MLRRIFSVPLLIVFLLSCTHLHYDASLTLEGALKQCVYEQLGVELSDKSTIPVAKFEEPVEGHKKLSSCIARKMRISRGDVILDYVCSGNTIKIIVELDEMEELYVSSH